MIICGRLSERCTNPFFIGLDIGIKDYLLLLAIASPVFNSKKKGRQADVQCIKDTLWVAPSNQKRLIFKVIFSPSFFFLFLYLKVTASLSTSHEWM